MYLMDREATSYKTFEDFINLVFKKHFREIFNDIPEAYIREIESGETIPSTEHLFQMCCIFGKTLDYMVKGVIPEEGNVDAAYYREQQFRILTSHLTQEHQEYIKGRLKYYYDLEFADNNEKKE